MNTTTIDKRQQVEQILRSFGSVLVACSGGVDSVLLTAVAADVLGANAVAATAVSPSLASGELETARAVASAAGIYHIEIRTDELANPQYVANSPDRCYHCKDATYAALTAIAQRYGIAVVVDGTNGDDAGDHRPGRRAAARHGVRSPLAEAGMTKAQIRNWARDLGLEVWDKPAAACLASRIPYGSPVTLGKLARINRAEASLKALGFAQCRVRVHDAVARIEVDPDRLADLLDLREKVTAAIKDAGFTYVSLDLEGFRSGSMNATLTRHG